ncbi:MULTISPECIES: nuclear transport factor 2 family protein [Flavobacterium]|jgi:ketosteroid isomerase-like protein|uniref:Nuclear transport factor 2 family protein n=1 Tax=Flavobacterium algoritolerans TaxID=3041254 RepID=A0ABT6V8R3_9FLAO|nr:MULTISPECIES: nuclear transport factor 2 family protein [Flavobacterium]MDI5888176.1 nuclear transport factor 2 family protein [Flavobacterium yafengii]MDI5894610.1 nuclear transport factor 2 family protein [Flavobacterium algoritolerans]
MRKIVVLIVLFFSANSQAQNQEIQKVVDTFFEAFHAKDTLKLQALCEDTMILQSISENAKGTKLSNEKPQVFFKSIASIPAELKFQEKILSYSIQVDGSMAHAWTPYEFYVNGKLSHKGVNAFTLFKKDNIWKIVHLIDTRRK